MKKYFYLLIVSLAVGFTSCDLNGNDYDSSRYFVSYGVLDIKEGQIPEMILDDNTVLYVKSGVVSFKPSASGKRVIANYEILSEKNENYQKNYEVRINAIDEILTKEPLFSSKLGDTIKVGSDPIVIDESWFSSKYLNINFLLLVNNPEIKHFINLVVDEENPKADKDNVYVTFTHNARGDRPTKEAYGRVSFDVSKLIPEGKNSIIIHLSYTNYKGQTISESGKITIGQNENAPLKTGVYNNSLE